MIFLPLAESLLCSISNFDEFCISVHNWCNFAYLVGNIAIRYRFEPEYSARPLFRNLDWWETHD